MSEHTLVAPPAAVAAAARLALVTTASSKPAVRPPKPATPALKPTTPPRSDAEKAKIAARTAKNAEIYARLHEAYPAAFCRPPVPLAVGIRQQILAAVDSLDELDLGRFLKRWCRAPAYLDAVAHREPRCNLDGSPAGLPTADQQREAALRVYGPRGLARLGIESAANQGKPEADEA